MGGPLFCGELFQSPNKALDAANCCPIFDMNDRTHIEKTWKFPTLLLYSTVFFIKASFTTASYSFNKISLFEILGILVGQSCGDLIGLSRKFANKYERKIGV